MTSEEKWAQELVQKVNDRDESKRIENEAFVLKEKLKRTNGPRLWQEFRETLSKRADVLNRVAQKNVFVCDMMNQDKITLGDKTIAEFDRERLTLNCVFRSRFETFPIKVNEEGEVYFCSKSTGPKSIDHLVERLIEESCLATLSR